MSRFPKKLGVLIAATSLVVVGVVLVLSINNKSSALSGSDWNAGNIISDDQFFNPGAMSTADIQNFLNSMVPACDTNGTQASEFGGGTRAQYGASIGHPAPYTCLKDYVENPTTHVNNANGGVVDGGWSSAQIIKYASDTYGISPKVLIVLLQKEQVLVTDTWPFPGQYKSATGYGCPDTAPCDAQYYGLYNQVINAARQFQLYAQVPDSYRYKAYQNNTILWNPSASCGSSTVYIANQATAGLYNYTPYQPNAAALNNLYGSGDSCSAYGNRNFWRLYSDWFGSTQTNEVFLSYKSSVNGVGWMDGVKNSGITGTTGQSKTMEAFRIDGSVEYSSYNNTTGWQPTVNSGMISGTTGLGRPIHALKINPLGALASRFDIYYRTHISGVGWMGWAKNGQIAGVTGDSTKTIEAIEIRLAVKGFGISGSTDNAYQNTSTTTYTPQLALAVTSHVGDVGWQPTVTDTMVSGTTEQSRRIEAIKFNLVNNTGQDGGISYAGYVSDVGWQNAVVNNEVAGTTGQSKRMEAICIAFTGIVGDNYDIWYRAYVQNMGWLGWVKNGDIAGSMGASLQLEAVETRVVAKGSPAPAASNGLYNPLNLPAQDNYTLSYSTHLSNIGWVAGTSQNVVGGTTGQSRSMEAIRFDIISTIFGNLGVNCSAYSKGLSWASDVIVGNTCGTTGQSRPLEGLKLTLTGSAATKYDIYYKVHLSYVGWQDWVKNGEQAGIPGSNKAIEAIIVKLVQK